MAEELNALLGQLPEEPPTTFASPASGPMVIVPPGEFWMGGGDGRRGDRHVVIAEPFYLAVYPVTQGQWKTIMGANPAPCGMARAQGVNPARVSWAVSRRPNWTSLPVEPVSCGEVRDVSSRTVQRPRDGHGWGVYRLPTEEEWEYACRSPVPYAGTAARPGTTAAVRFYTREPTNGAVERAGEHRRQQHAGRAAGAVPEHDVEGRVVPGERAVGAARHARQRVGVDADGGGRQEGLPRRLLWQNLAPSCAAAYRNTYAPAKRRYDLGFRVARVPAGQ